MGDKFLTKEIADALCTVITLGFAKKHREKTGKSMVFQYDDDADKSDYEEVKRLFKDVYVTITVKKSVSQDIFPYILGTGFPDNKKENVKKSLLGFKSAVNEMMTEAKKTAPKGAYIGILCIVDDKGNIVEVDDKGKIVKANCKVDSKGNIVEVDGEGKIVKANGKKEIYLYGPSVLSQYSPVYRQPLCRLPIEDKKAIETAYNNAIDSTNNAVAAILDGLADKGIKKGSEYKFTKGYEGENLFHSCHGMIRAMVNSATPDTGLFNVYAELALGPGTTKVSSCVPCAIFMQSFGYPASSIHLGRGDNWGLPEEINEKSLPARQERNNLVRQRWRFDIINYYEEGIRCSERLFEKNNTFLKLCEIVGTIGEIPDIFLEALTFEGSFTKRIINTFAAIKKKEEMGAKKAMEEK